MHVTPPFTGDSHYVKTLNEELAKVSGDNLPVLLLGEKGTGKMRAARWLHINSGLKDHAFTKIEAAEISSADSRIPSTIYIEGLEKLSESDAKSLLDKVSTPGPVRYIIAAEQKEITIPKSFKGKVISITPLRERVIDIPLLATVFLASFKKENHTPADFRLSETQIQQFQRHHWPENVSELKAAIRLYTKRHSL